MQESRRFKGRKWVFPENVAVGFPRSGHPARSRSAWMGLGRRMETMIAAWWTGLSFAGYPAAGKTTFEAERERISAGGKRNSDS